MSEYAVIIMVSLNTLLLNEALKSTYIGLVVYEQGQSALGGDAGRDTDTDGGSGESIRDKPNGVSVSDDVDDDRESEATATAGASRVRIMVPARRSIGDVEEGLSRVKIRSCYAEDDIYDDDQVQDHDHENGHENNGYGTGFASSNNDEIDIEDCVSNIHEPEEEGVFGGTDVGVGVSAGAGRERYRF